MKKYLKRILSLVCMVSIVVTSLFIVPEAQAETDTGLDRITLSDMGFLGEETTYESSTSKSAYTGASLCDTEIVFEATFSSNRQYLTFGHNSEAYTGIWLMYLDNGDGTDCFQFAYHKGDELLSDTNKYSSVTHFGEGVAAAFKSRKIHFKIVTEGYDNDGDGTEESIISKLYIDHKYAINLKVENQLSNFKRVKTFTFSTGITAADARKDWVDINVENFGIESKEYVSASPAFSISKAILNDTTLDWTNFEADVIFNDDAANGKKSYIYYGMTGSESWNGVRIYVNDTGTGVTIAAGDSSMTVSPTLETGETIIGKKLQLKIATEIVDDDSDGILDDVKLTASVGDSATSELILLDYSTKFGKYVAVYCQSGTTMYLGICVDEAPSNLTSVTWESFGIGEKIYSDAGTTLDKTGVCSSITNIKNTSFRGKMKITADDPNSTIFYYGDNPSGYQNGINFRAQSDGTLKVRWNGIDLDFLDPTKAGLISNTFLNTEFELGIDLWIDNTDLKMILYIDGNQYNASAYVWESGASYVYLYNAVSLQVGSGASIAVIYPEEELEPSPDNLTPITWETFGITATKTYLKSMGDASGFVPHTVQGMETLTTLVGTSFRGEVSFNRQEGNLIICYGATNTGAWDGIRIYPEIADGTLKFQGIGGDNPVLATLDPAKTDLTSGTFMNTEFELGIDLWESDGDIKMNIFIEGVQYNRGAYVWADAATNGYVKKANNIVVGNENNSLTVILPKPEYEESPEGLIKIDWEDFGVTEENTSFTQENEAAADGTHFVEMTETESVIGTSFRGIITMTRSSEPASKDYYYLCYGSKGWNWSGIRMNLTDGVLNVVGVGINADGTATSMSFGTVDAETAGLTSFTGIPFEFGIDIWEDGEDVKFNLFFNGEQYNVNAYTWEGVAEKGYFSNRVSLIVHGATDAMTVTLPEKVGCDIEATPAGYLLSGTTVRVNDKLVENGTTLTEKKDYHVLYVDENGASAEDVSCFVPGDAHPDDAIDSRDLVATKKASQGWKLTTGVAMWAADADKSLTVDKTDVELVRNMLLTATTAVSTVASYSLTADNSVMPIGGFSGPYGSLVSDKAYSLIEASGINFITFLPSVYDGTGGAGDAAVLQHLELAEKHNLSVFVTDHDIVTSGTSWDAKTLANRIKAYSKYKSFKGLSIVDEPNTNAYGADSNTRLMSSYADASRSINSYANLSAYVNLLPLRNTFKLDAESESSYTELYRNYLIDYCDGFKPKYLSYDHYPFEWGTDAIKGTLLTDVDAGRYFENLAIVRAVAAEKKIPFWTHIQTGDFFGASKVAKPDNSPSEGEFKWQVNVELAFGAKGIQYFPLLQPEGWEIQADGTTNYRHGLIGANGEKTRLYEFAKEINQQIKAIDHVLMNSESKGVMVTGTYATKNMNAAAECGMPILTSYNNIVTGISTDESAEETYGAIAGCFDYRGKTAIYVVNYNVTSSQKITLQLKGNHNFTIINRDGESSGNGETCTLSLNAGDGALIVF